MNDEQLILFYYNDGLSEREREEVRTALGRDDVLAARYEQLTALLDAPLGKDVVAPTHVAARWHESISRAADKERTSAPTRRQFHFGSFFWGTALTAALALGIGLGVTLTKSPESEDGFVVGNTPLSGAEFQAVNRGARLYLSESRQAIDRLDIDNAADRILIVSRIIEQNRMIRRLADASDAPELARTLAAMETVMVRLATDQMDAADAQRIQAQILFEMNIVLTRLQHESSEQTGTNTLQETTT